MAILFSICNADDTNSSEGVQSGLMSGSVSNSSTVIPKTSPMRVSEVTGTIYSTDYDGSYNHDHQKIPPPKNKEYDFQLYEQELNDKSMSPQKRLGWRDCCQLVLTWNSISSQFSPGLNERITNWFWNTASDLSPHYNSPTRCASKACKDVESSTPWRVKAVNTGVCHTPSAYATIFDAIKHTAETVERAGCRRCCVTIDHEGDWRGEIMITSDGSDPWYMDCSNAQGRYVCKSNENGPPECKHLTSVHDEL